MFDKRYKIFFGRGGLVAKQTSYKDFALTFETERGQKALTSDIFADLTESEVVKGKYDVRL